MVKTKINGTENCLFFSDPITCTTKFYITMKSCLFSESNNAEEDEELTFYDEPFYANQEEDPKVQDEIYRFNLYLMELEN